MVYVTDIEVGVKVKYSSVPIIVYNIQNYSVPNLSVTNTLGTTTSVLIRGVSAFQRLFCTHFYVAGTMDSVLIKEVSLFRSSLVERFHCIVL